MSADPVASAWATILKALGYDAADPHFADTPERVSRFFREWHTQTSDKPKLTTFANEGTDELIVTAGIPFYSMCAHHGAPFFGHAAIGYIPGKKIIGLSKFARVVTYYAHRFSVQERVTKQIADELERALKPRGLGVMLVAEHLCMSMRGVEKPGHATTTSDTRGLIRKDHKARSEFFELVKKRK